MTILLKTDDIRLTVKMTDGERKEYVFGHVVMATGHDWPETKMPSSQSHLRVSLFS
jgi:cation diffusion facilitator CzcD-associated flavoprotein CzcO